MPIERFIGESKNLEANTRYCSAFTPDIRATLIDVMERREPERQAMEDTARAERRGSGVLLVDDADATPPTSNLYFSGFGLDVEFSHGD